MFTFLVKLVYKVEEEQPKQQQEIMLSLLLVCVVPLVAGHGGMLWPPAWQDGKGVPLNKISKNKVYSDPVVVDPASGRSVISIKNWLTDQAYLGGHGDQYFGVGNITNPECSKKKFCKEKKTPWAAPGRAVSLGGGCGIFGGNPYGCPAGNDTRAPGSVCGQYKSPRGTFAFGSSALDMEFPQALTTEWALGSQQDVAWVAKGGHLGGYTYRLCKMPLEGKTGITEECFAQNVLKFATPYTRMRQVDKPGKWKKVKQDDLTEGTYPPGSAWRHIAVQTRKGNGILRKDTIVVPTNLPEGDYVLSFRWDTVAPQIWVSCGNIKLVALIG